MNNILTLFKCYRTFIPLFKLSVDKVLSSICCLVDIFMFICLLKCMLWYFFSHIGWADECYFSVFLKYPNSCTQRNPKIKIGTIPK